MTNQLTPIKAIRKKCLDCSCGSSNEVKLCPVKDCALFPYRFGKRPATALKHTEKRKQLKKHRAIYGANEKNTILNQKSTPQSAETQKEDAGTANLLPSQSEVQQ